MKKTFVGFIVLVFLALGIVGLSMLRSYMEQEDVKKALRDAKNGQGRGVYAVIFNSRNSTVPARPIMKKVAPPARTVDSMPIPPVKTGFSFAGWFTGTNGNGAEFLVSTPVTNVMTVYAKWNMGPVYHLTYDSDGGSRVGMQYVTLTDKRLKKFPKAPLRTGYHFSGWFDSKYGGGSEFTTNTPVLSNRTVYAKWNGDVFSVVFDSRGAREEKGPAIKKVTFPADNVDALPARPVRTGYDFSGWFTGTNGTGLAFSTNTTVDHDITVYANWTALTYTVVFESGDAMKPAEPGFMNVTYPVTNIGSLPAPPVRNGFAFGGWFTSSNGAGTAFLTNTAILSNFQVYAYWNTNVFLVIYDSAGANVPANPESVYVIYPVTAIYALPEPPVRSGFDFAGWYSVTNGGGTQFTPGASVESNITVYAYWKPKNYMVIFIDRYADSTADPDKKMVNFPSTTVDTLPVPPEKINLAFAGWVTSLDDKVNPFSSGASVNSDLTVFAAWSTPGLAFTPINNNSEFSVTKGNANANGTIVVPSLWWDKKVTSIGTNAFQGCASLIGMDLPAGIHSIENQAFWNCRALKNLELPRGVTTIGQWAFYNCSSLTSLSVPNGVMSIRPFTFSGCSGLTNLDLPNGISSIGTWAFAGCSGLSVLVLPAGLVSIGDWAFKGCTGLTGLKIPGGVLTLGNQTFWNCSGLTHVDLPSAITNIGNEVFYNCSGLTDLVIPKGVKTIGNNAFWNCSGLTNITIPESVVSIGSNAFLGCASLKTLTMEGLNAPSVIVSNTFSSISDCALHLHEGSSGYIGFAPWNIKKIFNPVLQDLK